MVVLYLGGQQPKRMNHKKCLIWESIRVYIFFKLKKKSRFEILKNVINLENRYKCLK